MYAGIAELSGYRAEYIATPSTSNWHHIAIIYDNSTTTGDVSIYLNGSSQSTTISQNDKALNGNFDNQTVYALARGGSSLWSDAKLDDVRIYNRALSGSEITSVYSNPQ
jgi:hypothetical protein